MCAKVPKMPSSCPHTSPLPQVLRRIAKENLRFSHGMKRCLSARRHFSHLMPPFYTFLHIEITRSDCFCRQSPHIERIQRTRALYFAEAVHTQCAYRSDIGAFF